MQPQMNQGTVFGMKVTLPSSCFPAPLLPSPTTQPWAYHMSATNMVPSPQVKRKSIGTTAFGTIMTRIAMVRSTTKKTARSTLRVLFGPVADRVESMMDARLADTKKRPRS